MAASSLPIESMKYSENYDDENIHIPSSSLYDYTQEDTMNEEVKEVEKVVTEEIPTEYKSFGIFYAYFIKYLSTPETKFYDPSIKSFDPNDPNLFDNLVFHHRYDDNEKNKRLQAFRMQQFMVSNLNSNIERYFDEMNNASNILDHNSSQIYLASREGAVSFSNKQSVTRFSLENTFYPIDGFMDNHHVPLDDSGFCDPDNLPMTPKEFETFCDKVDIASRLYLNGHSILVHCTQGQSRSVLFTICLLMNLKKMRLDNFMEINGSNLLESTILYVSSKRNMALLHAKWIVPLLWMSCFLESGKQFSAINSTKIKDTSSTIYRKSTDGAIFDIENVERDQYVVSETVKDIQTILPPTHRLPNHIYSRAISDRYPYVLPDTFELGSNFKNATVRFENNDIPNSFWISGNELSCCLSCKMGICTVQKTLVSSTEFPIYIGPYSMIAHVPYDNIPSCYRFQK